MWSATLGAPLRRGDESLNFSYLLNKTGAPRAWGGGSGGGGSVSGSGVPSEEKFGDSSFGPNGLSVLNLPAVFRGGTGRTVH